MVPSTNRHRQPKNSKIAINKVISLIDFSIKTCVKCCMIMSSNRVFFGICDRIIVGSGELGS